MGTSFGRFFMENGTGVICDPTPGSCATLPDLNVRSPKGFFHYSTPLMLSKSLGLGF